MPPSFSRRSSALAAVAPTMTADWDREWGVAWKAHPANPWFAYQADRYAELLAPLGPHRLLKTDGFEEACGFDSLGATAAGVQVVHMDVSPRVLAAARGRGAAALAAVTDIGALGFRPASFDVVFSPSTLDHFDDPQQITRALAELAAVLRPGGRLVITLDNPGNPVLRLRTWIHRHTGQVGGLIPFRMGSTLSRRRLVEAVGAAGLLTVDSGYLIHAPRVLGLWLGEWAARYRYARAQRMLRRLFGWLDAVVAALPTRRWTGHFVVIDCIRPAGALAPVRDRHAFGWLRGYHQAQNRIRKTYLRMLPQAVMARIDPPLRTTAMAVRRALAVPLYLRQRVARWSGPCDGETARVVLWGKAGSPRGPFRILFDADPSPAWADPLSLRALLADPDRAAGDADLLIAETTPALADRFVHRGFCIMPNRVRFGARIETLLAATVRPSDSLASDLARVRRTGYRVERWSYSRARSRFIYYRYVVPHAYVRFRDDAWIPTLDVVDPYFALGSAVAVVRPGADDPDAVAIVVPRGNVLWWLAVGTLDGDRAVLDAGGLAALYLAVIELAREQGFAWVDAGRCHPWRSDGVARFKMKWGFRPTTDQELTLEYAIKVLRPESAAAQRFATAGAIFREGEQFYVLGPGGARTAF